MTAKGPRRIHLGEFNLLMNGSTYLPLVSGLLRANAETSDTVREHFAFAPFLFHNDRLEAIVGRYERPAVAAFSSLMWNEQLSLRVAAAVKRRWPECLIVFGGASVPHEPRAFFAQHRFVDVAVRGEGESPFLALLERLAATPPGRAADLEGIPGTTWRTPAGEVRQCRADPAFVRDLDEYPSPYLAGLYEDLFAAHPDLQFQAIIETNRGCPFQCTFCYWGKGGLSRKYRFHGVERVQGELEWMAAHGIRYVFNADSNFGMHRRDQEIAELLLRIKQRTGYPDKFRTCYGKNTDEKIFAIGKLLHDHQLEKGITISYQSVDPGVQENIKRSNIKLECAHELQRKFNDSGVPVYTELILGLPGETLQSWIAGVDRVLASGLKNQLFMYICQVLPNTDLAEPEYLRRFGVQTRVIDLTEIHGRLRTDDWVKEREEIVVATAAMPPADWQEALLFSWMTMLMHSLKLGFFVLAWMVHRFGIRHSELLEFLARGAFDRDDHPLLAREVAEFTRKVERLRAGQGRGCVLRDYGDIYWDEEEASFLRLSRDFDAFYEELRSVVLDFLDARRLAVDLEELDEVIRFQSLSIPRPDGARTVARFERDWLAWFDALFSSRGVPVAPGSCAIAATQPDFAGDLPRYARETILWGRKSGTMLTKREAIVAAALPATR